MQLVIFMLVGSLILGMYFEKLERKSYLALVGLVAFAIFGFLYVNRFL